MSEELLMKNQKAIVEAQKTLRSQMNDIRDEIDAQRGAIGSLQQDLMQLRSQIAMMHMQRGTGATSAPNG